eukprot:TRINITY_DN11729_c0_g1_i1.p1 TRINITY_DN11729_c0_g1~~TRINITY_DN11729_c0_g1_i1.p1  ORF type:complete len:245 (-),score=45.31 TRINITY_DN11729_c0_g1_i1:59-793(-)
MEIENNKDKSTARLSTSPVKPSNLYFDDDSDLDLELLDSLLKLLQSLLRSESVECDVTKYESLFRKDSGRRIFVHMLHQSLVLRQDQNVVLAKIPFQQILSLITLALTEMHISNPADYISAKALMECSTSIIWTTKEKKKHVNHMIKDYINQHVIWQNLNFWEEYFWDKTSQSFSTVKSKPIEEQITFMAKLLKDFGRNMIGWGNLPLETLSLFLTDMAKKNGLPQNSINTILEEFKMLHKEPK